MKLPGLLPCPFCGNKAEFVLEPITHRGTVRCSGCLSEARLNVNGRARGIWVSAEQAAMVWNRRAPVLAVTP